MCRLAKTGDVREVTEVVQEGGRRKHKASAKGGSKQEGRRGGDVGVEHESTHLRDQGCLAVRHLPLQVDRTLQIRRHLLQ